VTRGPAFRGFRINVELLELWALMSDELPPADRPAVDAALAGYRRRIVEMYDQVVAENRRLKSRFGWIGSIWPQRAFPRVRSLAKRLLLGIGETRT
jgi:hypothetical protein